MEEKTAEKASLRIGISKEIPKGTVFQYIKKRNGQIVPFDKSKISNAIYLAAKAVGGEDKNLAEKLADEVTLFLYTLKGDKTPEIEEIQDTVEKILIESGHARTAKAYILYRRQREILRKKKLLEKKSDEREATDYALFVRTSDDDFVSWDRNRIINALQNETGLEPYVAKKIAEETEETILDSSVHLISSSLIREIVNVKLIEHGLENSRLRHTRLGIPIYDTLSAIIRRSAKRTYILTRDP